MANPQVQLPGESPLYMPAVQSAPATEEKPSPAPVQIDSSDPINSLADHLVTPEEREAKEQQLLKNKRKMIAWTALMDGLRNIGNLYAVSKGATPLTFTNPYQQIDKAYNEEYQRQGDIYQNRDRYVQTIINLRRQGNQDRIREEAHKAQMKWYDTRDEIAGQKAELDRLKAARVIKLRDGSLIKYDPVTGVAEPLTEADPMYVKEMEAKIGLTNKRAGLLGAPVTTTTTGAKGTSTSVKTYGSPGGGRKASKKNAGRPSKPVQKGTNKSGFFK